MTNKIVSQIYLKGHTHTHAHTKWIGKPIRRSDSVGAPIDIKALKGNKFRDWLSSRQNV